MKRQQSTSPEKNDTLLISKRLKNPAEFCESQAVLDVDLTGKAMSIYLIRRKIFSQFSSAKELLICRLVCKTWDAEATSALLQPKFQRALQISFRYSAPSSAFTSDNRNNSGRSLGDFIQDRNLSRQRIAENVHLKNDDDEQRNQSKGYSNFLDDCCTFFKFQSGNLGADSDAIRFFMDPESKIKSLTLDLYVKNLPKEHGNEKRGLSIENFRNMLLHCGKSLKFLDLVEVPTDWGWRDSLFSGPRKSRDPYPAPTISLPQQLQDSDFLGQFDLRPFVWARTPEADQHLRSSFPALEILKLSSSPSYACPFVVNDVLRGAPNLKETFYRHKGEYFDQISVLETEKKLQTLKSLHFGPQQAIYKWKTILELENPNRSPIQLKKFGVRQEAIEIHGNVVEMLNCVLKDSQNTLEVVYEPFVLFNCPGLVLPQGSFHKVTRSKVTQCQLPMSTRKLDLSQLFPNLKHFKIEHSYFEPDTKPDMEVINRIDLSLTSPLTSVLTVDVIFNHRDVSSFSEEQLLKIKHLFPNFTKIHVSTRRIPEHLPQLLQSIFKCFTHARAISFKFRYPKKEDYYYSWIWDNDDFLLDESWVKRMDSVITGTRIPMQQVDEGKVYVDSDATKFEEETRSVSILDMKDLQYFGMDFEFLVPVPRLFSQRALDCGFNVLKNRKKSFWFHLGF